MALDANTEALVLWSIQHYDYGTVSSVCLIAAKCETCRNEGGGWWGRESEGERASKRDKFHAQATSSVRMCMQTHLCTRISMHAYVYVSGHPCTGAGESGRAGDRGAGAQAAASRGNDAADRAQAHRQRRAREAGVPERSKAEPRGQVALPLVFAHASATEPERGRTVQTPLRLQRGRRTRVQGLCVPCSNRVTLCGFTTRACTQTHRHARAHTHTHTHTTGLRVPRRGGGALPVARLREDAARDQGPHRRVGPLASRGVNARAPAHSARGADSLGHRPKDACACARMPWPSCHLCARRCINEDICLCVYRCGLAGPTAPPFAQGLCGPQRAGPVCRRQR